MVDIVKEIRDFEENGGVNEKKINFFRDTMISRDYFKHEVLMRYPNLEFIRIFMKKTDIIYGYELDEEYKYYLYSVYIDKNMLKYLASDLLMGDLNGEIVIDLSRYRWSEQIKIRNKILSCCSIIMAECNYYYDDTERHFSKINIKLSKDISIYPYDYKIDDYELMNFTRFVLISNSSFIEQSELNELCLEILKKLFYENKKVIDSEKAIYLSISDKLKRNRTLTLEERIILEQFINNEIDKVDKINTLLVRSRKMA